MESAVLIIDDDRDLCGLIAQGLRKRTFKVDVAYDADAALEAIRTNEYDAIAVDVILGETDGIELCARLVENRPGVPVIIITGHGDMATAIQAIRAGAHDFVTKPLVVDALALTLQRAIEMRDLTEEVKRLRDVTARIPHVDTMVGDSKPMRRVYELIEQVATSTATVLITGESGTGKELVARAIHDASPRNGARFVAINCAAVSPTLIESELFGHVKGAFTDARTARTGLFVQASGGTLFLDEIGEMAPEMQAKLLRVLQERRVRPVGGDSELPFDTRIIAATNKDLETEVEEGRFRADLFYRVNVFRIAVPPLRSRGRDILELAQQFLTDNARTCNKDVRGISRSTAAKLLAYEWPGNVRELQNCIEHAVTLARFEELSPEDMPDKISSYEPSRIVISGADPDEMPTLVEVERRYLRRVLEAVRGNKAQAARVLGVDRRTLYRKLERLEVTMKGE
ncbi:MAG TPA: sigma-54 dependent transcriptional regulator [Kofleriaceae bacterium]|nr:sigma-54 dependent transcriptional regulator [Kofleriaceae bacterium]